MEYDLEELLEQFIPEGHWKLKPGTGGMNNTTCFAETANGKYVLRVYETHRDIEKVLYEHSVLLELNKMELPFDTPAPVRAGDNETVKYAKDGKLAALFGYMDGSTPAFDTAEQLYSFGLAAGKLTGALKTVATGLKPVYKPYYEIDNTHPKCSMEKVIGFCKKPSPEFEPYGEKLLEVASQLNRFRENISRLQQLPHQLIHGDLNASNVLADKEGNTCAVLDFEFVTEDLRVMEPCVCFSEIINMEQSEETLWEKLQAFSEGYRSAVKLTEDEISAIPLLIMLRRLDVFIHFLGRYWDGIDDKAVLIDQINNAAKQVLWLKQNEQKLADMYMESFL